jgi:hypothetical protein
MQTLDEPAVRKPLREPLIYREFEIIERFQKEEPRLPQKSLWQRCRRAVWTVVILFLIAFGFAALVLPALIPAC